MPLVEDLVEQKLSQFGRQELLQIWQEICSLYKEGGPDLVESRLLEKARDIKSKFAKEAREIESGRSIVRARKMSRRRKR